MAAHRCVTTSKRFDRVRDLMEGKEEQFRRNSAAAWARLMALDTAERPQGARRKGGDGTVTAAQ